MYRVYLEIGNLKTTVDKIDSLKKALSLVRKESKIFEFDNIKIEKYETELERCI